MAVDPTSLLPSPLVASATWLQRRAAVPDDLPQTTLNYRSPEVDVADPAWGEGVDLWAVGCVLVEMYSGKADFFGGVAAATDLTPTADPGRRHFNRRGPLPLGESGRAPLFRAESPFEHLAMVERCVGRLPPRLYGLWANVDAPASVGPSAASRVSGVAPSLAEALEGNRGALAEDWESRRAVATARLGDAKATRGQGHEHDRHLATSCLHRQQILERQAVRAQQLLVHWS
jgi:hypothetical protein